MGNSNNKFTLSYFDLRGRGTYYKNTYKMKALFKVYFKLKLKLVA